MKWTKLGCIFKPQDHTILNKHTQFAQSPQVITLDDRVRVYFSTRVNDGTTEKFKSHVAYVDFDYNLKNILDISQDEIIPLGNRGCFDEHGVFPFSPFQDENRLLAYTCGWSRRNSVSVETATGFAESFDNGQTFQKLGQGQIFGASLHQPFLVGDSFVRKFNDSYHMWYMFGQKWVRENDAAAPDRVYKIGHATSQDGIEWTRENNPIISDALHENECQALPSVIFYGGIYHMVFCYRDVFGFRTNREKSYRLGYAYSFDLHNWTRHDKILNLPLGRDGEWDCDMMCYPHLTIVQNNIYLLYNGNAFGRDGFGAARLNSAPEFKSNTSNVNDIFAHFQTCDQEFIDRLSARTDINKYVQKLYDLSLRIEAWNDEKLIGLIAMYRNDDENSYFISNMSVSEDFKGQGLASQLLTLALHHTKDADIKLEVFEKNISAINLYKKFGFSVLHTSDHYDTMALTSPQKVIR